MIYTKDINGRQVFSSCTTIELNGRWVSNPTEEQIEEAGWSKYTPPAVTATPMSEPSQEELLDAVKAMLKKLRTMVSIGCLRLMLMCGCRGYMAGMRYKNTL